MKLSLSLAALYEKCVKVELSHLILNSWFLPISNKSLKRINVEKKDDTLVEEIWKRGKRSKRNYFRKSELPKPRSKGNQ